MTNDPYEAASTATIAPRTYYGEIQIDAWFCVLTKGVGKEPFNEEIHKLADRRTAIDVAIIPLPEQNITYEVKRNMIVEMRDWAGITWPSLKELGATNARDLEGKYAKAQLVSTGRKWRGSDGNEREGTTLKFLALYPDAAACSEAYLSEVGGEEPEDESPVAGANGNGSNGNHALDAIIPFIGVFAKQANYDLEKTKAICAAQEIITKAIDVESPEFAAIVAGAMAGGK